MADGGKGSSPRPFSVTQSEFNNRWDNIFKKDKNMQVRVQEDEDKIGQCGCGRSPTGKCIGWHGLAQEVFEAKLQEYNAQQLKEAK
jgi:hypothetical protein